MAHPNPQYDPLPVSGSDFAAESLYNNPNASQSATWTPPSAGIQDHPAPTPPQYGSSYDLSDPGSTPPGGAQPRFMGSALYSEAGAPRFRDSLSSTPPRVESEYGSIYALHDRTYGSGGSGYDSPDRFGSYRDDPRGSYVPGDETGVLPAVPAAARQSRYLEKKNAIYAPPQLKTKRKALLWGILGGAVLLIIIIAIGIYFGVVKPKHTDDKVTTGPSGSGNSTSGGGGGSKKAAILTGGDGSTVTIDDGTTFVYSNPYGGTWYWDATDPFNNAAQAQTWTPALNSTFNYGTDKIKGVNLGGWLVTEPFIAPALYEKYNNNSSPPVDEWTLVEAMTADAAGGGIGQLETHYKTFITEQDFAQIAGAGLNYVRISLGYWAIEVRDGESFYPKVSWTYFLKAIQWARKYGIRINLDFHSLPGSQNGWNHSGRLGTINMLNGPMGYANAQRSLDYIRILAEFISQPEYSSVVTMFGITNEPAGSTMGQDVLSSYYLQAYNLVRTAGGTGTGNGPMISYHDGFFSRAQWAGFLTGADRISLDDHPYICFNDQSSAPISSYAQTPCGDWGSVVNASMGAFGLTIAGEFSLAVTDCGKWLNGVDLGSRYEGTFAGGYTAIGSCDPWTDWPNFSVTTKTGMTNFALASMDALQNWFFWTWKIGNSTVTGKVESPQWSYSLGLQQGWMPADPRVADGTCGDIAPWAPPLAPSQLGTGAPGIAATDSVNLPWPPATIAGGGPVTLLPSYTPTGVVSTLPGPTFTATKGINVGNGWQNPSDTAQAMVAIATCSYLDPWVGAASPPSPLCAGTKRGLSARKPMITQAPYL